MKNIKFAAIFFLLTSFCFAQNPYTNSISLPVENHSVYAIWPENTDGININIPETVKPCGKRFFNIYNPNIQVYKPEKPNGTSIVLCAGGGYSYIASGVEGIPVAEKLNKAGVTVFILKYRLPTTEDANFKHPVPLSDALRAIQFVRYNAKSLEIDSNKVGIMGFSAGGHLAASAGTLYSRYNFGSDKISLESSRPDFMCLLYPVISTSEEVAHGCIFSLVNDTTRNEKTDELSCEKNIIPDTPTAFIVHASDDNAVSPTNSILFYNALKDNNVKAELKIYDEGEHGFGLGRPGTDSEKWTDDFLTWLGNNF